MEAAGLASRVVAEGEGDDLPSVDLGSEGVGALPLLEPSPLPRSFLRDGRAWTLLPSGVTLVELPPTQRRRAVHDGRCLQADHRPPEVETKHGWPAGQFSVSYMTSTVPQRFCFKDGSWGSSADRGKFAIMSKASKHVEASAAGTVEQARRKDAAIAKAARVPSYLPRAGVLSHTTGSSLHTTGSSQASVHSSITSEHTRSGGEGHGQGTVEPSDASAGADTGANDAPPPALNVSSKRKRDHNEDGDHTARIQAKAAAAANNYKLTTFTASDMFEAQDNEKVRTRLPHAAKQAPLSHARPCK